MSSVEDNEVARQQNKEAYNHELITSEDFYVSEIEALVTHVVNPLIANASRCNIKSEQVTFVFGIIQHILQFHLRLLRIIRDELTVIHSFETYIGFIQMYSDYYSKYMQILDTVSIWCNSMEFREFMTLRLQNEQCQKYIDNRLCSIPWYLYRPFERIKQYYRFFKDLEKITLSTDEEYKKLLKCKEKLKKLHDKIRHKDLRFITKTRLLEIQLQIFGNPEPIVSDHRYFVYNRICQVKLSGHLGKKYKHIHLYIFNDGLLWCSKRGQFKKGFKFINTNLIYGIPDTASSTEATLFIQYGSRHKISSKKSSTQHLLKKNSSKKLKKKRRSKSSSTIKPTLINNYDVDEYKEDIALQINHGKPTKKTILIFVNEKARDQCLQKIKQTQTKYLNRLQRKSRRKLNKGSSSSYHLNIDKNKLSTHSILTSGDEQSLTLSQTEDSSLGIDINGNHDGMHHLNHNGIPPSLKALESHKSVDVNGDDGQSDDQSDDTFSNPSSTETSKSSFIPSRSITHSNNGSVNIQPIPNCKTLKQSVSTEITTIQEEDEDDVKAEHD